MKRSAIRCLLIMVFALGMTPLAAYALTQDHGTPDQQAPVVQRQREPNSMWQKLNLTDDQKAKMKDLRQQTRQQVQAVRNDSSLAPEQRAAKIREIRRNNMKRMQSILTPEQRKQHMQQMRRERRQKRDVNLPPQE